MADDVIDLGTDPNAGGDDIDAILNEIDQLDAGSADPADAANAAAAENQTVDIAAQVNDALANNETIKRLDEQSKRSDERELSSAVTDTVTFIQESSDILKDRPVALVRALLDNAAKDDPRILKAFELRESRPEDWKKIQTKMAEDFGAMIVNQPDANLTADRDAARNSVLSRKDGGGKRKTDGETTDEQVPFMSDTDFNDYWDSEVKRMKQAEQRPS